MGKIDIDKFMLSLFSQHGEMPKVWEKALLDQGLKFQDGELVSVVSPGFEVGDVIKSANGDTTVITEVTDDFYSTDNGIMPVELQDGFEKIGEAITEVIKDHWYVSLKTTPSKAFVKGNKYLSPRNGRLFDDNCTECPMPNRYFREWSVQVDAKPGEFLNIRLKNDSKYLAIFKGIDNDGRLIAYAAYNYTSDGLIIYDSPVCVVDLCEIWPADISRVQGFKLKIREDGKSWDPVENKIVILSASLTEDQDKNNPTRGFKRALYRILSKFQVSDDEDKSSYEEAMKESDNLLGIAKKTIIGSIHQRDLDDLVCNFKNSAERFNDKRVSDIYRQGAIDLLELIKTRRI